MWRSILGVLLIPSLLWAQEPSSTPDRLQGVPQKLRQDYQVLTEWQTMKRGTNQKAVIRFFLIPGYVVSPYEPSRDLVPLKLEFEEADGVRATSFRFDTDRRMHFSFHDEAARKEQMLQPPDDRDYSTPGDPRSAGNANQGFRGSNASATGRKFNIWPSTVRVLSPTFEVAIKLKASKMATLGAHLIRGKLTYQRIFDEGALPPQQMEVALPITVGDKDTIAQRNAEYMKEYGSQADTKSSFEASSKSQKVGLILLAPVLVPLLILENLACGFWGEDCSC